MKKIKIEIKKQEIKSGLFKYDFPQIKELDYDSICFRVKETVKCENNIFLNKNDLISFYSQNTSWGQEPIGVFFDLRKNGFDLENIKSDSFVVDFEYSILTKKRKSQLQKTQKQCAENAEIERNKLSSEKRVVSNIVNLVNIASNRHDFFMEKDNIEDILKNIDYHLIICSPEIAKKYEITTIVDSCLPPQIILCIKKDMTSEVINIKDYTMN